MPVCNRDCVASCGNRCRRRCLRSLDPYFWFDKPFRLLCLAVLLVGAVVGVLVLGSAAYDNDLSKNESIHRNFLKRSCPLLRLKLEANGTRVASAFFGYNYTAHYCKSPFQPIQVCCDQQVPRRELLQWQLLPSPLDALVNWTRSAGRLLQHDCWTWQLLCKPTAPPNGFGISFDTGLDDDLRNNRWHASVTWWVGFALCMVTVLWLGAVVVEYLRYRWRRRQFMPVSVQMTSVNDSLHTVGESHRAELLPADQHNDSAMIIPQAEGTPGVQSLAVTAADSSIGSLGDAPLGPAVELVLDPGDAL